MKHIKMALRIGRLSLIDKLKNKLSNFFSQDERIIAAYLFGSHADGSDYEGSDLDLGILVDPVFEQEFTLSDELELEFGIETALGTDRFDFVVVNKVPLTLQFRIISPAKLIYVQDDDKRCEMEEQIMTRYYDFQPRLQEFNREYFAALREEYGK